ELFSSKNLADMVTVLYITQGSLDANRSVGFPAHFPDDTKGPVAYYVQWFILGQKLRHIGEEGMQETLDANPNMVSRTPNLYHVIASYSIPFHQNQHTEYIVQLISSNCA